MLYEFFSVLFAVMCLFLILLVLIQRGKSSAGIGNMGGGAQTLFGGAGGQDIFQKITWILGAIFVAGSIFLGYLKQQSLRKSRYIKEVTLQNPDITSQDKQV